MGTLQEPGWQSRTRTSSCSNFHHSNVKPFSQRRQSAPSIIINKALTKSKSASRDCLFNVSQDPWTLIQSLLGPTRKFITQGNVLLQTGLQTQERFLLLFTDLLIITKAKSVMQVKQKVCVRLSEMWTASCVDEVCEGHTVYERSFVMGWPTHNCVATFSTSEEKERWLFLIECCINEEKKFDDPKIIPLKIFTKDVGNCAYAKTFFISNTDSTSDVICRALQQFGLSGGIKDYQLWVCSKKDETPYPLIGHEFPFSIKMNCIRSLQQDPVTAFHSQVAFLPIDTHCQFCLRPRRMSCTLTGEQKRKRRMSLISWPFKRGFGIEQDVQSESKISLDHITTSNSAHLFGRPLNDVINDNTLPSPILDMLMCLRNEGAVTCGIFRRSAGVKACRELREKLDSGHHEKPLNGQSVFVIAAVFKDFLRNIPGSLLCDELFEQWLRAIEQDRERNGQMTERNQLQEVQRLVQLLPKENLLLLRHIMAMLHHIQLNAEHNQMTSFNLAVCIAPSCLWNNNLQPQEKDVKKVCDLVHFLIDNCCAVFGDDVVILLMDLIEDNRSNNGSVGSLQQMSDSGYDSLKNEVNTDIEDIPKSFPLKKSRSMDSLVALSDCDHENPDDDVKTESSNPLAQIRNFTPAVRQPRSHKWHRNSVSAIGHALKSNEQKLILERGKFKEVERPTNNEVKDSVLLEYSFQQLTLMSGTDEVGHSEREKQTPPPLQHRESPSSSLSSPVTSPTCSPVSSMDSIFSQSSDHVSSCLKEHIQNFPPKGQSDYKHPIILQNENMCLSACQRDGNPFEGGLHPKVLHSKPSNPLYQQALLHLNRKPLLLTTTQMPVRSTLLLQNQRSLFYRGHFEDQQVPLAPQNFKSLCIDSDTGVVDDLRNVKSKTEFMLPQSMFYGQSCKLTVHRVREQNLPISAADSKTPSIPSVRQWRFKGLDLHPPTRKTGWVSFSEASSLRKKMTEHDAEGKSHRLKCCSNSLWIGDRGAKPRFSSQVDFEWII
ncbi:rho GTPase-activating protein 20 [Xyrauchen texanus]|uniref:rho GTPase-activating protein 20 n=1 Tax=Xyrauchen texanus TaxID=154827 RepID=UPI0022427A74|nr:rho GTPase-activating protein 20 [Xyrauchen texanus]